MTKGCLRSSNKCLFPFLFFTKVAWEMRAIFAIGFLSLLLAVSAPPQSFAQVAHPVLNLRDFGAVGDGKADDTNAVRQWLGALTPGTRGYAPAGVYVIHSPLESATPRISIAGDGPYQTIFAYAGTDPNVDILTIENVVNWHISGLRITAFTRMTGGAAVHLKHFCRSMIDQVVIDGQDGTQNLWNGIWFDAVDMVTYRNFDISAQNDAVMVNGGLGRQPKADLMLAEGKIEGSQVGLRVGGGFWRSLRRPNRHHWQRSKRRDRYFTRARRQPRDILRTGGDD